MLGLSAPVTAVRTVIPLTSQRQHRRNWCSSPISYSSRKAAASICRRYSCLSEIRLNVCGAGIWAEDIMWQDAKKMQEREEVALDLQGIDCDPQKQGD